MGEKATMGECWPRVPLGEVITQRKGFIQIDDLQTYKRCRVQLHAKGVVLRDIVQGAEVKTKEQQVCRAGEFLVAEIDAKVGGYGLVPPDLNGAIVSSHYFLFQINEMLLYRQFLHYFIQTPAFADQVAARGSTNYAAIRPKHVLGYVIPLPPLNEQRRIVAQIEALAAKIEAAWKLRQQASQTSETLGKFSMVSFVLPQNMPVPHVPIRRLTIPIKRPIAVKPGREYQTLGVKWWGKGVYKREIKYGQDIKTEILQVVQANDMIYNKMWARHGSVGIVPPDLEGAVATSDFPLFILDQDYISPEYFSWVTKTPWFWNECELRSYGTSDRRRVNSQQFLEIDLPVPSLPEQRRIVARLDALQAQVAAVQAHQIATSAALEALKPSILDRAFRGEL